MKRRAAQIREEEARPVREAVVRQSGATVEPETPEDKCYRELADLLEGLKRVGDVMYADFCGQGRDLFAEVREGRARIDKACESLLSQPAAVKVQRDYLDPLFSRHADLYLAEARVNCDYADKQTGGCRLPLSARLMRFMRPVVL